MNWRERVRAWYRKVGQPTWHVVAIYPAMDREVAHKLVTDLTRWDKRLSYTVRKVRAKK